jgi:hypothetical protein
MKLPATIYINVEGEKRLVRTKDYIKAKTKQLIEFGYPDLTEAEVRDQLVAISKGEELSVIGKFMEDDIVK